MFKRSLTYTMRNDSDFGEQAVTFGKKHEFADFLWLPSQGKVVYRRDDRVAVNTSGNGLYDFLPFRSQLSVAIAIIRSSGTTLHNFLNYFVLSVCISIVKIKIQSCSSRVLPNRRNHDLISNFTFLLNMFYFHKFLLKISSMKT